MVEVGLINLVHNLRVEVEYLECPLSQNDNHRLSFSHPDRYRTSSKTISRKYGERADPRTEARDRHSPVAPDLPSLHLPDHHAPVAPHLPSLHLPGFPLLPLHRRLGACPAQKRRQAQLVLPEARPDSGAGVRVSGFQRERSMQGGRDWVRRHVRPRAARRAVRREGYSPERDLC